MDVNEPGHAVSVFRMFLLLVLKKIVVVIEGRYFCG